MSRTYRLSAYRQFVVWIYGHLGKYNRIVVPACAVHVIRQNYEEQTGHYVGFAEALVAFIWYIQFAVLYYTERVPTAYTLCDMVISLLY